MGIRYSVTRIYSILNTVINSENTPCTAGTWKNRERNLAVYCQIIEFHVRAARIRYDFGNMNMFKFVTNSLNAKMQAASIYVMFSLPLKIFSLGDSRLSWVNDVDNYCNVEMAFITQVWRYLLEVRSC